MAPALSYGPLYCDLDLDQPGQRIGEILLTHSDDLHGYGAIPIPLAVIRGSDGPTVLLSGGNHGDEYEGQILLRRLINLLEPHDINGRLIIMPSLNLPAVKGNQRVSPLDQGNLNRSFPGAPDQGPTRAIAGFITNHLLPIADYGLDLHSGGASANYLSCGFLSVCDDSVLHGENIKLAEAFGASYTIISSSGEFADGYDPVAHTMGVPFFSCELGGNGGSSVETLEVGWRGILGILVKTGILGEDHTLFQQLENRKHVTRFLMAKDPRADVMAEHSGLMEPLVALGDEVAEGQPLVNIYSMHGAMDIVQTAKSPYDGIVAIQRTGCLVEYGNYVCSVYSEIDQKALNSLVE